MPATDTAGPDALAADLIGADVVDTPWASADHPIVILPAGEHLFDH
ncbi:hypothetical protein ACWEFJ_21500 [Actinosynnema sp. NPDC004786]